MISKVVLWEPSHGKQSKGRPMRTFINKFAEVVNLLKKGLSVALEDRNLLKEL